jgi:hypothetical protein
MQKLITGFAAAAALALLVSTGQAACELHSAQVTASVSTPAEGVAMSTYDGATPPTIVDEATETAAATECPENATDCVPTGE